LTTAGSVLAVVCAAVAICADSPAQTNTGDAASKKAASPKGRSLKSAKKPAPAASRRSPQQRPTVERYQEIQQALADKGYFKGPVDGNWGPDSVDALTRFQHEQNLTEDGKIGSLSLIALGLGPKRAALPEPPKASSAPEAK
jgi:peptidoglycan hydrolase-like protein with peptidoglycan-binding domain